MAPIMFCSSNSKLRAPKGRPEGRKVGRAVEMNWKRRDRKSLLALSPHRALWAVLPSSPDDAVVVGVIGVQEKTRALGGGIPGTM